MGGLVVDLNGHLPPAVFNQKVGKPTVLVDVGEGVLGVEIAGFLGAEGVGEQFDEEILGTATGGGVIGGHRIHLNSQQLLSIEVSSQSRHAWRLSPPVTIPTAPLSSLWLLLRPA